MFTPYMEPIDNMVPKPSRNILLADIPPHLNDAEILREHFGTFGMLLSVKERFDENPTLAIVTFFSIIDAISAFIASEPILGIESIQMSWLEYTKQCSLCSYQYSSEESIKQHVLTHHYSNEVTMGAIGSVAGRNVDDQKTPSVKEDINNEIDLLRTANENMKQALEEKNQELELRIRENSQIIANYDSLVKKKVQTDTELESLQRRNAELIEILDSTITQRNYARAEIDKLSRIMDAMHIENQNFKEYLHEKCQQLRDKNLDVVQITRCYEKMQEEAQTLKCTLETLKQENTKLNNNLNMALEQRDLVRQEIGDLYEKVQPFNHFRENLNRRFEEKCQQLDQKEFEFNQIKASYQQLWQENERLLRGLKVQRDVMKENETLKCEVSSLKLKINDINKDLIEAVTWNTQLKAELVSVKRDKCLLESEIEGKNRQLREKDGEIRALLKENDVLHNEYDDMLQEIKTMSVDLAKKSNALSHLTLENLNLVEELENNEQLLQNTQSNLVTSTPKCRNFW